MLKAKEIFEKFVTKHGNILMACAFTFVTIAANSACALPYYEPEEPSCLNEYKKFNK